MRRDERDGPLTEPHRRGLIRLLALEVALFLQDPFGGHEPAREPKSRRLGEPPEHMVLEPPVLLDAAASTQRAG